MGQHVANIIPIERDEEIIRAIPVKDFETESFFVFITKNGMIKKTELRAYKAQRYSKPLVAINLKDDDQVIDVHLTDGKKEIFLISSLGYALWFHEEEISIVGARAAGVKGINLKDGDFVVGGKLITPESKETIVIATQRGSVKRMKLKEFEKSTRAKRGVVILRELKSNPHRVTGFVVVHDKDIIFIQTEKGYTETIKTEDIRYSDRYSNGSFVLDEGDNGKVTTIWKAEGSSENPTE
jgi:topoisomerase-4 subunit A